MYSGTTLKPLKRFDAWLGAHQKIDRLALKSLEQLLGGAKKLPTSKEIMAFEGIDGPDGIKRKSPSKGELWHYYNPNDPDDFAIIQILEDQYSSLVKALKSGDRTKAAFEMAWLAHGVVDGLTPAHQYPYEKELIKLRGGEGNETRTTASKKIFMPGDTVSKKIYNNWKMWGDKGLLATHFAFEWGVALIIGPLRFSPKFVPAKKDAKKAYQKGMAQLFADYAHEIADLNMYERFYKSGWTVSLAKTARSDLIPPIVQAVTLVWYCAVVDAKIYKR
jgi:hypothetical protein